MGRVKRSTCRALGIGTWRPATVTGSDVVILKVMLVAAAVIRAIDYGVTAAGPYGTIGIEQEFPAWAWMALCALVATTLALGMLLRSHGLMFTGHWLGATVYMALSIAAVQHAALLVPPDEFRRIMPLVIIATLHATFALRTGPKPLGRSEEATVSRTVAPTN